MKELLFTSLRTALWGTHLPQDAFKNLAPEQWSKIFAMSMCQGIAPLVGEALIPTSTMPREVKMPWLAEIEKGRRRYEHHLHCSQQLLQFYNRHGIRSMLLKGWAVGRYYPKPELRPSKDIDLYHFGKWKEADKTLQQHLGIEVSHKGVHHTKYLFHGVTIENHYDFVGSNNMHSNLHFETLLKRMVVHDVQLSTLLGETVYLPNATFEALFLMRHLAGHFASEGITLRHLCDWAMFVDQQRTHVDWDCVAQHFLSFGMMPFVGAVQGITEKYLDITPLPQLTTNDEGLSQRVLNEIMCGEFQETHTKEDLARLGWKIRRFRANRWKYQITSNDSIWSIVLRGTIAHLRKPYTILHKV